jgi:hypothetical protein
MAIIAPLFAFLGRFVGKVVQMVFGWATVLLFGRVPESKQLLLSGVALGSIVWVAVVIGVIVPDVGAFLIAALPVPDWIDEGWIRLAMLIAALILPLLIGVAGLFLVDPEDRPTGRDRIVQVLRGYPYAAILAFTLVFLAIVAPIRKVRSIVKRWEDAHIPVVVKPNGYERVADDLEAAIDGAGIPIERAKAPVVLEAPSKLLAAVGGASVRRMVPDRLVVLQNPALEITVHPSDVAMSGGKEHVARARAALASRMTFTAAYQTTTKEAQEIEDALEAIASSLDQAAAWHGLDSVDERLASLTVEHEDWEVLYRQRLQVERALRQREERGEGEGPAGAASAIGRMVRTIVGSPASE